jgi:hypothetical protein
MATDPQNLQYDPAQSKFFTRVPGGSGAAGSPGVTDSAPGVGGGAVIATPAVSNPFDSSQIAANRPAVPVTQGDTSGFSDDVPVHQSPLLPGQPADYMSSGAGQGHAGHFPHPNAAPGRA